MIIINRALSQRKKNKGKKRKGQIKKVGEIKGTMLLFFFTLVLQSSTMIFMTESLLCCHFHILVGILHYRTWLVYSNDGLPQNCLRSSWASKLDAHPLSSFIELSYLIAPVHLLHGNPYSLTLISIDGHLHSPLIRLVDVRLSSPFFVFSTTTILFHL